MKKIKLNSHTSIDLDRLINTRLLVQANSGGGKSWLLRRILEQSHGEVQQIIIDLEGEFSTLREKYDYILAGKDGDVPAEPRSAGLLARKLLELGVSAIVDLYELPHQERKHFVKLFLEAMINAPKELWHPCIVVIDEAHVFCPEKGQSEAMEAVIDLATRGRKRGYCAVLATQRLSKLHKDAAAECNNKLVGRTGLDIDMKRASEELGFTTKEQYLSLRSLEAGEFFAFGSAISTEIVKVKVGGVSTTHPRAGSRVLSKKITPPTAKIKQILKQLTDLPEEARKEAQTISELKKEIVNLRSHRCIKSPVDSTKFNQLRSDLDKSIRIGNKTLSSYNKLVDYHIKSLKKIQEISLRAVEDMPKIDDGATLEITAASIKRFGDMPYSASVSVTPKPPREEDYSEGQTKVTGGALRMLKILVSRYPIWLSKSQLATFAKLSPKSGTYRTYLSALRGSGLIEESDAMFRASQAGIDYIGEAPNPPQTTEEVIAMWKNNLNGGARRMFEVLVETYPLAIPKEYLGERTGLNHSSGTFGTYLSILRSNSLVEVRGQMITASKDLFS